MKHERTSIGVDDNRLLHMRAVGRRAYDLAREVFGWSTEQAQQMLIMGFLHDIGYEFVDNQRDHEHFAGELLQQARYIYWQPIYYHGEPDVESMSTELLILNIADMQTSPSGKRITSEQRLADISARYGCQSPQYSRAEQLVQRLEKELNDRGITCDL